ncbi:MAG: hypothetical protein OS130_11420 [Thermodesulfobacteriota bacterium]|jgi:hypothetical protein|nr:MAG: hypothetical protein OS130_11420 [Thermodesulfobacteriota bacterium]
MEKVGKIILTTMVLMLLSSVGYGSDWKYIFTAPTGGEWFYDTQGVSHGQDTTLVWTKWILSDKEREKFIKKFPKVFKKKETMVINGVKIIRLTNELLDTRFFIQKEEINCSKNVAKIISMSLYVTNGDLVWFSGTDKENQLEDLFPDSKGVTLIEAICKETN